MKAIVFVGKKWLLEVDQLSNGKVVVYITEAVSANTVAMWTSPTNLTSEVVSSLGLFSAIPKTIQQRAYGLLHKWEKKTKTYDRCLPLPPEGVAVFCGKE